MNIGQKTSGRETELGNVPPAHTIWVENPLTSLILNCTKSLMIVFSWGEKTQQTSFSACPICKVHLGFRRVKILKSDLRCRLGPTLPSPLSAPRSEFSSHLSWKTAVTLTGLLPSVAQDYKLYCPPSWSSCSDLFPITVTFIKIYFFWFLFPWNLCFVGDYEWWQISIQTG